MSIFFSQKKRERVTLLANGITGKDPDQPTQTGLASQSGWQRRVRIAKYRSVLMGIIAATRCSSNLPVTDIDAEPF